MSHTEYSSDDLRVKRTHKLVLEALIEQTVQKGFSALTVSDITKHAGINRATFYRHFKDKFDLLDSYAQAVYELLEVGLQKPNKGDTTQIYQGLTRVLDHIRANARFYQVMMGKHGDPAFTDKIRQYIQKRIRRSLPPELKQDEKSIDLYISYSSSASIGAILWWLEHELPYSAEEMAAILYQLESGNLKALLEREPSQL
jgi:AcrR family transcriptional regulator